MTAPVLRDISEQEFADKVVALAHVYGWKIAHFGAARTEKGWRTPVRVDGKGFPDFVMVHPERQLVLFVELKARGKKLTPEQKDWGLWLGAAGANWQTWWAEDWPQLVRLISNNKAEET